MNKVKYYDEGYYLNPNGDNKTLIAINKRNMERKLDIVENEILYKENIRAYYEYINLIAYMVRVLSLPNNSICQSIVLNMLINNGLFSYEGEFKYKEYFREVKGFPGLNVVLGEGSMQHVAGFNHDVLSHNKLMSDVLYGYLTPSSRTDVENKKANAAINLIEYKNNLYGFDSKHEILFSFKDRMRMDDVFGTDMASIYYKPYMDMINGNLSIGKIHSMMQVYEALINKPVISKEEYEFILNYAKLEVGRNKELFDEFKNSSKKYIKRITNQIK